jgi:hypothetical protein
VEKVSIDINPISIWRGDADKGVLVKGASF